MYVRFSCDIHRLITHPDNENALAPEVDRSKWVAIGMRMDLWAIEVPGVRRLPLQSQ